MEDDTERGYIEELKKDYGIDLTRSSKNEEGIPNKLNEKPQDEVEPISSDSSIQEERTKLEANLTSEERKKFLLDRHEKLTIENENLKKELEEIKVRIQSFRTADRQQEQESDN